MKIIAAVVALALAAPVAAENWEKVAESRSSTLGMDLDSIIVDSDHQHARIAWVTVIPKKGTGQDANYQLWRVIFHCDLQTYGIRTVIVRDIRTSDVVESESPSERYTQNDVVPGSLMEGAADVVCADVKKKRPSLHKSNPGPRDTARFSY